MLLDVPAPRLWRLLSIVLLGAVSSAPLRAQAWLLDPAVAPSMYQESTAAGSVAFAPLEDGRLLAYGEFTHASGRASTRLARLQADGSADATFSSPLTGNERVSVVAPLPDGRAIAVVVTSSQPVIAPGALGQRGPADTFGIVTPIVTIAPIPVPPHSPGTPISSLVRLLADGRRDPSFTPLACDGVPRLTPLADGRIIVWGSFRTLGGVARNSLARLDATGALDAAFGSSAGVTQLLAYSAVAPAADGALVVSGYVVSATATSTSPAIAQYLFRRLDAAGAMDARFAPGPVNGTFSLLVVQADGGVLAGNFTLFRYTPTGALDATFSLQIPSLKSLSRLAPLRDGRLVIEASVGPANTYGTPAVFVVRANGQIETDLRTLPGAQMSQQLLAVLPNGSVLLLQGRTAIVAVTSNTDPVPGTSAPSASAANGTVTAGTTSTAMVGVPVYVSPLLENVSLGIRPADASAIAAFSVQLTFRATTTVTRIRTDVAGRAVVSGYFTHVDGQPRPGLARFNADGTLDRGFAPAFAPSAVASVVHLAPTGGPILQTASGIARLRDDGSIDPTFVLPSGLSETRFLAAANDGRLLVAAFDNAPSAGSTAGAPATRTEASLKLVWLSATGQRLATLPTRFGGFGYWATIAYLAGGVTSGSTTSSTVDTLNPSLTAIATTDIPVSALSGTANSTTGTTATTAAASPTVGVSAVAAATAATTGTSTATTGTTSSSTTTGSTTGSPDPGVVNVAPPTTTPIFGSPSIPEIFYVVPHAIGQAQVLADGSIVVTGSFLWADNSATPHGVVWLRPDGTVDAPVPPSPTATVGVASRMNVRNAHPLPDGRALIVEHSWTPTLRSSVFWLNRNGTTTSFLANIDYLSTFDLDILADGALLLRGQLYSRDGVLDANFAPRPQRGAAATTLSTAARAGNRLWLGGSFDTLGGQPRASLARLESREVLGITFSPQTVTTVAGRDATFTVVLGTNQAASVQWFFNGVAIPGATGLTLGIADVTTAHAGSYHAVVTVGGQTSTSAAATLSVERNTAQVINFSARSVVTPGAPQVAGFVLAGSAPREVFLRATGRGLPVSGIATEIVTSPTNVPPVFVTRTIAFAGWVLPVPVLTLHGDAGLLASDRGNGTNAAMAERARAAGAFAVQSYANAPVGTVYASALSPSLAPGAYSAVTTSGDGGQGESLFELYDVARDSSATTPLRNVAIRARLTAGGTLSGGFVISGNGPRRLLVRGIGPALGGFGINDAVRDPELRVLANNGGGVLATNTHWSADPALAAAAARTGAFPLSATSSDTALVIRLEPGSYTAQLSSASRAAGTAMVELYVIED